MNDKTYFILFELYLIAGVAWLFILLFNKKLRSAWMPFLKRFRPNWRDRYAQFIAIVMLAIFVPLLIGNTLNLMGKLPAALK